MALHVERSYAYSTEDVLITLSAPTVDSCLATCIIRGDCLVSRRPVCESVEGSFASAVGKNNALLS